MLENEVTPVLKALRKNGIDVIAIHNHMIEEQPMSNTVQKLARSTPLAWRNRASRSIMLLLPAPDGAAKALLLSIP